MGRFPGERFVRVRHDPDLGRLELWSWPRPPAPHDAERSREEYLEWRGASGALQFFIGVDVGMEPEEQLESLDSPAQTTLVSLSVREPALRRKTAKREIELARDWTNNPSLSENELVRSLRASHIDVYTDAVDTIIDLYFDDTMNVFSGHIVAATLDKSGDIKATGIEG